MVPGVRLEVLASVMEGVGMVELPVGFRRFSRVDRPRVFRTAPNW